MFSTAYFPSQYFSAAYWSYSSESGLSVAVQGKDAPAGSSLSLDPLEPLSAFAVDITHEALVAGGQPIYVSDIQFTGDFVYFGGFTDGAINPQDEVQTLVQVAAGAVAPYEGTINIVSTDLQNPSYFLTLSADEALRFGVCGDAGVATGPAAAAGDCKSHQVKDGCCLTI